MKFFAVAMVAAAFSFKQTVAQTLGQACVSSNMVKVFNRINEIRTAGATTASAGIDYNTNVIGNTAVFDDNKWQMRQNNVIDSSSAQNYQITVLSGSARMTEAYQRISNTGSFTAAGNGSSAAMTWSEGLALGNASYVTEWVAAAGTDTAFTSLTSNNGTTTVSRATANGTVTGSIVETAYFFDAFSLDATDFMRLIITNDGTVDQMAPKLFESTNGYTVMSAAIGSTDSGLCTMDYSNAASPVGCGHVFIITGAQGYTNASGVATCDTSISYGGGICDPDTWAMSVFEQMNEARESGISTYKPLLDAIAATCSSTTCSYNWEGLADTSAVQSRTILTQAAGVTAAGTAMADNLAQYTWIPGMFMAAEVQTTYLSTASDTLSTHGTSNLTTRATTYGTVGSTLVEGIYKGDNSAVNTVTKLLIDDADSTLAFRNAFVTDANAQAGVSCATHTSGGKVCTVLIGAGYSTSSDYSGCVAAVTAAAATPNIAGAYALAASTIVAASMAALF